MNEFNANLMNKETQYPLSTKIIENKLVAQYNESNASSGDSPMEILTLVGKGNGIFSLEKENGMNNQDAVNLEATKHTFGRKEDDVALSVQKKDVRVHESLVKETLSGKSITIIVTSVFY